MKCFIGIEDRPVRVRCETQYGETFCVSVRDTLTGYDIRPYLDQETLDRLVQDYLHNELAEAIWRKLHGYPLVAAVEQREIEDWMHNELAEAMQDVSRD